MSSVMTTDVTSKGHGGLRPGANEVPGLMSGEDVMLGDGAGGALYSEVQGIMDNGHMETP